MRKAAVAKKKVSSAKRARRAEQGAEKRQLILAAALEEFSQRGFAATRLEDVAKRADVAKGTIYLYFSDKEALFQELLRAEISPVIGMLEVLLAGKQPANISLRDLALRVADLFVEQVYFRRLYQRQGRRIPRAVHHRPRLRNHGSHAHLGDDADYARPSIRLW